MRISLCALGVAIVAAPTMANAFYVESRSTDMGGMPAPIRYEPAEMGSGVEIEYRVNPSTFPDGVEGISEAIDAAFATWSSAVDCDTISFTRGDDTDSVDQTHWMTDMGEIYILVFFVSDMNEWLSGPSVGRFFWSHDGTGKMTGASIFLNSFHHTWTTTGTAGALDVQSIVTAQIGRSLGITSAMEGNATYPSYAPDNTDKRTLGTDDLAAITYLYPGDGAECMMPSEPEALCDGVPAIPPAEACPPRPMTNPNPGGDGGVVLPGDGGVNPGVDSGTGGFDAGPTTGVDSGVGMMMGDPMDEDDGCGCHIASRKEPSAYWALLLGALVLRRRRRR